MQSDLDQLQPAALEPTPEVPASPEAEATPASAADETPAAAIDLLGESIPVDQVLSWREAFENRDSWERSGKHKDMRYAEIRKELERGFNDLPMDKWGDLERAALRSFADIERNVRTDPEYFRSVQEAFGIATRMRQDPAFAKDARDLLAKQYEAAGATPAQAQRQATQDVKDVQAAGREAQRATQTMDPRMQQAIDRTVKEVEQVKSALVSQELGRLEGSINTSLDHALGRIPETLKDHAAEIEEQVLDGIHRAFDPEGSGEDKTALILQAEYDGTLTPLIDRLTQQAARRMQALGESVSRRAAAPASRSSVAAPFKGGAGAPADAPITDMKSMHARMTRLITGQA